MSAFTPEQLTELTKMFEQVGTEIEEHSGRDYCTEGSASREAVGTVGGVLRNYEPMYAHFAVTDDNDRIEAREKFDAGD